MQQNRQQIEGMQKPNGDDKKYGVNKSSNHVGWHDGQHGNADQRREGGLQNWDCHRTECVLKSN